MKVKNLTKPTGNKPKTISTDKNSKAKTPAAKIVPTENTPANITALQGQIIGLDMLIAHHMTEKDRVAANLKSTRNMKVEAKAKLAELRKKVA